MHHGSGSNDKTPTRLMLSAPSHKQCQSRELNLNCITARNQVPRHQSSLLLLGTPIIASQLHSTHTRVQTVTEISGVSRSTEHGAGRSLICHCFRIHTEHRMPTKARKFHVVRAAAGKTRLFQGAGQLIVQGSKMTSSSPEG
ncbi:hypothetical protein J3F83DRAFT_152481 [Trichoderma novae-zelandiae]